MFEFILCIGAGYLPKSSFLSLARGALHRRSGALPSLTLAGSPASLPPLPRADTALFQEEDDYDVMQDPEFLQSVLENLPGVDPNNEAIRNAMGSLASQATKDGKKDKKEEDKK